MWYSEIHQLLHKINSISQSCVCVVTIYVRDCIAFLLQLDVTFSYTCFQSGRFHVNYEKIFLSACIDNILLSFVLIWWDIYTCWKILYLKMLFSAMEFTYSIYYIKECRCIFNSWNFVTQLRLRISIIIFTGIIYTSNRGRVDYYSQNVKIAKLRYADKRGQHTSTLL